jgi:uncharacterized RmlC-like cupin family protein
MASAQPVVIQLRDLHAPPGPPTSGMDRREILDDGDRWLGWLRTDAGLAGGWHHHGDRDSYIYVISGSIAIDFGPGGRDRVEANAGDVVVNPKAVVHREVTGPDEPVTAFVVRVGPGPLTVNVEGPDPEE